MSITGKALTVVGYAKAPKATFLIKHPVKAVSAWVAYRAARKVAPKRRALAAATAAAVALPFAWRAFGGRSNGARKKKR